VKYCEPVLAPVIKITDPNDFCHFRPVLFDLDLYQLLIKKNLDMIKMNMFSLGIGGVVVRFFLMMTIIIVGVFAGMPWLTVLGLPIFLSALLGVSFSNPVKAEAKTGRIQVHKENQIKKAS